MERYEDFCAVTEASLAYTCERLVVTLDAAARARLMDAYLKLTPYADVVEALPQLTGYRLAILSNGSPNILGPLVRNAGLAEAFRDVISVDELRIYKPSPQVYRLACDRLRVRPDEVGFVSSNPFDVAGAKSFGMRVFWINRNNLVLDRLGYAPDATISKLTELVGLLRAGTAR